MERRPIDIEISVELEEDDVCAVKIQSSNLEVNVRGPVSAFEELRHLPTTDWSERRSLQVGRSAGQKVWWSRVDSLVSLLIGEDDEVWDIGIELPSTVGTSILAEIDALLSNN